MTGQRERETGFETEKLMTHQASQNPPPPFPPYGKWNVFLFFPLSLLYREKSSFDSAGVTRRVSVCVRDRRLPAAAGVRGLIRWGLLTMRNRGVCVCVCLCIAQIRDFFLIYRWHGWTPNMIILTLKFEKAATYFHVNIVKN